MNKEFLNLGQVVEIFKPNTVEDVVHVPSLTFVIPSYNHHIDRQLSEIENFFEKNPYTVIAIDDGSFQPITETEKHNLTIIKHESNVGLAESLIDGYKKALETPAEIIIRADADGEYPISAVSKAIKILENNDNVGVFVEHKRTINSNGLIDSTFHNIMGHIEGNLLLGFPMNQHSPGLQVYRREIIEQILPILENYVEKTDIKWGLDLMAIKLASEFGNIIPITLKSHIWKERRPLKKILSQLLSTTRIVIASKTGSFSNK